MSDYEWIKEMMTDLPYLVLDATTGVARLADQKTVFQLMLSSSGHAVVNLGGDVERIADLIGREDKTFGLRAIAKVMGSTYHNAYAAVRRGCIVPSIRPCSGSGTGKVAAIFSWSDAYAAGVIGSLRKLGIKPAMLAGVQALFCQTVKPTKKQATRQVAAAGRS